MKLYLLILFTAIVLCSSCKPKAPEAAPVATSKENMRAKTGETVWIITNKIKPQVKEEYEKFMKEVFINALTTTTKDSTKLVSSKTRFLTPKTQNRDSTWTYVFIMDPWVPGGNYSEIDLLKEKYPLAKAMSLDSQYTSYMKEQPMFLQLIQSEQ